MTRQNDWNFDATYTVGDILYADTTDTLTKLNIGADGEVLTLSGGVPVWAAGGGGSAGWTLLDTQTGTGDLNFTSSIDSSYDIYAFIFDTYRLDINQESRIRVSTDGGSVYRTTNYGSGSSTFIVAADDSRNQASTAYFCQGIVYMYNPATSLSTYFEMDTVVDGFSAPTFSKWIGTTPVNAVKFYRSGGTGYSSTIKMYGIAT